MGIETTCKKAISILKQQGKILRISEVLLKLTTNHERVLFVYEIVKDLNLFPNLIKVDKSDVISTQYRNQGNQCFQKALDYEAWQYYNLSLLYSNLESENYILALSNRSAVFYSLKKYKECLQDIDLVLSMNYPQKIKDKILNRKKQCEENLKETETDLKISDSENRMVSDFITLKGPRDSTYLSASTKIKIVYSPDMGRHVVANEDIKVGDILIQENSYFNLILKSQLLFICSYCLSRKINLLPCPTCCYSMFCSKECMEKAWKEYHCFECPLMPTLLDLDFTKLEWIALRTTIRARTDYSTWNELFKSIEKAESLVKTEHWGQVNINNTWIYDSKYYPSIHTLATNIEQRSVADIFQRCVTAAIFLYSLAFVNFLEIDEEKLKPKTKCFVAGTLLIHLMTSATNMHGISSNIENADGNFIDVLGIASAPYAIHSLINHSCAPDVVRYSKLGTGQMTLVAIRPIKKGSQIFDNYGLHHALQDRESRQRDLKRQYKFTCVCVACTNNWPMYFNLKLASNLPASIMNKLNKVLDFKVIEKLQKADIKTALDMYGTLCKLAEDLEPYAPCKELSDCQETLKQCFSIFEGVLPYGFSKLVEWDPIPAIVKSNPQHLNSNVDPFNAD